jgi:NADPH:quinone reductase-like Zn-dependent oxidoreductase
MMTNELEPQPSTIAPNARDKPVNYQLIDQPTLGLGTAPGQRKTMQAIVQDRYGSPDVLVLQAIDQPVVKDHEVLVRVRAASANPRRSRDWHLIRGMPYFVRAAGYGLRRPKHRVPGSDIAGQVQAVGKDVTRFRPGDAVFADADTGGFAEYTCVAEDFVELKPSNLTFAQAAAVPLAAVTALQGLRDVGQVHGGQRILIIGASGGVGTFAVQIAKVFGAELTGVCSTPNVELVRSLGADHVIDYTKHDFTRSGHQYDVIFQLAGTQSPSDCRRALTSSGTLVLSSGESDGRWIGPVDRILKAVVLSPFVSQRLRPLAVKRSGADLRFVKELIEAGKVTPVIDRTYSLNDTADAIRYLETGHARGKIPITA